MENFKSFGAQRGTIHFGGLSLIIGTNASGKSNIRDGLRFIHGISRKYSIAEIIGEKYGEGGELQWKGIRGGVKETVLRNGHTHANQFTITVKTRLAEEDGGEEATYSITVDVGDKMRPPLVIAERLVIAEGVFDAGLAEDKLLTEHDLHVVTAWFPEYYDNGATPILLFRRDQPILTQIENHSKAIDLPRVRKYCAAFLKTISSIRFLDLDPQALRRPSIPGQTVLGDKGENLSSVLQSICADPKAKEALIEWTRELTPLDIADLNFPEVSLGGKIQLQIEEAGGRQISADSASDGTLRFLAFAAALLGTEPARFYFFEEIENGIHPNRAHLLVNLLQEATRKGHFQVAGTTHSPALLSFLEKAALHDASLVYRAGPVSKIRQFSEIKELEPVNNSAKAGDLLASGWFEDMAQLCESEESP